MMIIFKYIKLITKQFIDLENDSETILENSEQDKIIQKSTNDNDLENKDKDLKNEHKDLKNDNNLENEHKDLENNNNLKNEEDLENEKKKRLFDYLTLKNLIYLLLFFSFIGGAYWLYSTSNNDSINNVILEELKNFKESLKKFEELHNNDLHRIRTSLGHLNQLEYEMAILRRLYAHADKISLKRLDILMEMRHIMLKLGKKIESEEELTKSLPKDVKRNIPELDNYKFKEYLDIYPDNPDIIESD